MALESLLETALGRRKKAAQTAADGMRVRSAPTDEARQRLALDHRRRDFAEGELQRADANARKAFLGEREDRRASAPQPFSLVGKDFFGALGRKEDEAAWEGKTFNLGGMQEGRPAMGSDPFNPLRQRMKTVEEKHADALESGDRANLSRRRDESLYQSNRGAEMRNDILGTERDAAVFDPDGDNAFGRDMERAETKATFGRDQADLDFKQKLRQYFDPAHQGMLDNTARRENEAGLESARIKGEYDLAGRQATAQGQVAEAQVDAAGRPQPAEKLLESDTFIENLLGALSADPASITPQQRQMLDLFRQISSRGGARGGGGEDPSKIVSRSEVEAYARENRKDPALAARELEAQGYVIR